MGRVFHKLGKRLHAGDSSYAIWPGTEGAGLVTKVQLFRLPVRGLCGGGCSQCEKDSTCAVQRFWQRLLYRSSPARPARIATLSLSARTHKSRYIVQTTITMANIAP